MKKVLIFRNKEVIAFFDSEIWKLDRCLFRNKDNFREIWDLAPWLANYLCDKFWQNVLLHSALFLKHTVSKIRFLSQNIAIEFYYQIDKKLLRSNFVCGVRRKPFEFDETFWTNIGLLAQCALCNVRGNFSFQGIVSASGL